MKPLFTMLTSLLMLPVRVYQLVLSPLWPASCRFYPVCSDYAKEALSTHGPLRGAWLTLKRLGRCHPLGGCGVDPVPERK